MHPAHAFLEVDPLILAARVGERGFAIVIGIVNGRPVVAHAPVLLSDDRLRFHLSTANALCPALQAAGRALVVVTGDDAYISPDWYGLADQVPTWNYVSVEIEGPVRTLDRKGAAALLDDLAAKFESSLSPKEPWTRAKMNPARFEAMLSGIVAFDMTIERLVGTTKLSQNKPDEAIASAASALSKLDDAGARAIAGRMSSQMIQSPGSGARQIDT